MFASSAPIRPYPSHSLQLARLHLFTWVLLCWVHRKTGCLRRSDNVKQPIIFPSRYSVVFICSRRDVLHSTATERACRRLFSVPAGLHTLDCILELPACARSRSKEVGIKFSSPPSELVLLYVQYQLLAKKAVGRLCLHHFH